MSARNSELTAYVQDNISSANKALFEEKAAQEERKKDKGTLYRDMIEEREQASLRLQALSAKDERVDKFIDAYMSQGASPSTTIRKWREAVITPVEKNGYFASLR